MKDTTVMTYSAGVDSLYMLTQLAARGENIHILHIDFGHPACDNEVKALNAQVQEIEELFLNCTITKHFISLANFNTFAKEHFSSGYLTHNFTLDNIKEDLFFPARNALMSSTTFFLAQCINATRVICPFTPAIHYTDEELPDLGPKIIKLYQHLGQIYDIKVSYPFGWFIEVDDDRDVIKDLLKTLGKTNALHLLNLTYSCLKGTTPPCGSCVNCLRRTNVIERVAKL